ncbi:translation machinery-associated protein 16 [Fomitopsis serialis]|uniref:translation machinery-associated protein 16 n=1 Tax=Fomitopsis serialis TaxID=139415 RepID=UPI00200815FC|nr:translation machinery-associated protein 16 [Neoantrodia serialis]KAH9924795.1 translation machinery-associated protein 16 [Neoantrodia serialis]
MAPPKTGKKAATQKKEKLFHPQSRKAEQLIRVQHRKTKLADQAKARLDKQKIQADIFSFFYHALPAEGVLSLESLHTIVRDVWIKRFDEDLEEERKSRRKGRPKSTREQKLEELQSQEAELYRTGMEVLDLTDP